MSSKYPIEALLRPIVEFYVAFIAVFVAMTIVVFHAIFLLTINTAIAVAMVILLLGYYRFCQGWRIYRYQRGLLKLPAYFLKSSDVPTNHHYLFIGRGFEWGQAHTQRLEDVKKSKNKHYLQPSAIFTQIRSLEKHNSLVYALFHNHCFFNPFKPLPDVGGSAAIHAVGLLEGEKDIYESLLERVGHKLVLGTTRVGKTRVAEMFISQDIRRGDTTVVFDPKGDAELMIRTYIEAKRLNRPVYVFHLGYHDISCKYNAIGSFTKITEVAGRISDQLPADGNSAVFRDFAWGFVNVVARALVKAGETPDFKKIRRYINDINPLIKLYRDKVVLPEHPGLMETLQALIPNKVPQNKDPECFAISAWQQRYNVDDQDLEGILKVFRYDNTYYSKLVASLGPLLDKLTSGKVADLLSPELSGQDQRPTFDWTQIIRQNAVVYVGLDALSDATVAHAVGAAMFADLTSVAGKLYKYGMEHGLPDIGKPQQNKLSIHADEFNELIGDQFLPMINKAGGAGYQVTAYTQSLSDIEVGVGNKAKASVIKDNFNTLVMMRVRSAETAKLLTDQLPEYEVNQLTFMSQASDSAEPGNDIDFTSSVREQITSQRIPAVSVNDIINLPKGQAFATIEGGQLYKLRLPLLVDDQDDGLPRNISELATQMKGRYNSDINYDVLKKPMVINAK